jgi:RND family efflux transporter MFP subunit
VIAGPVAKSGGKRSRSHAMAGASTRKMLVPMAAMGIALAGCSGENHYVAPPPPKVTVALPIVKPVTRYLEVTGNTAAINSADLVARVPGFVNSVDYTDGASVKKGDLLFTIEPEPYEVKLRQAREAEAGALATLKQSQADFDRQATLVTTNATSRQLYDQALATRDNAEASYQQAQANTKLAALNNDYAHVKAPFDGIVTARQVSVGEYVGGSATPTVLATIVQVAPIYANFNIAETDVLRVRAEIARRGLTPEDLKKVPVEIGLQTETGYPHVGTLDYASPTINTSTGTLAARAIFQNTDRSLLPGYFVRVRIPEDHDVNAVLVPDVALGSDQTGRYVLVVNKDDVVEHRNVKVGPVMDELRVIDSGLTGQDRVIVAGVLRAVPGQKVDPQMQAAAASATGAQQR